MVSGMGDTQQRLVPFLYTHRDSDYLFIHLAH